VFNPSHQRRTTNKSRFVVHVDGNWYLLQQSQQDLFPYLGDRRPDIDQFDLTLPDPSREYREAWEASRVPLIESDEYRDPTSSEESSSEIEESDALLQQIRQSEILLDADTIRLSSPRTTFRSQTPTQTMATQTVSPPLVSVEVEGAVVMREQQGNNVEPNPEYEGRYES